MRRTATISAAAAIAAVGLFIAFGETLDRAGPGDAGATAGARRQRRRQRRARAQAGRRRRAVQEDGDPQRHADRRHRRSAAEPDGHRHRRQPDHRGAAGRLARAAAAGQSRAARRRLRDRRQGHVRDARLRRRARARRRQGQGAGPELLLQAVAGARRHHRPRRVAVVGRAQQLGEEPLGEERDRRAAHLQLPDARLRLAERPGADAREGARVGALGRRQQHRRHQVLQPRRRDAGDRHRGDRRGAQEQDGHRRPPVAEQRRRCSTPAAPATRTSTR